MILNRTTDQEEVLAMLEAGSTGSEFGEHDEESEEKKERMSLSRLRMAIDLEQKEFVAHPSCQQLLSHLFYKGYTCSVSSGSFNCKASILQDFFETLFKLFSRYLVTLQL